MLTAKHIATLKERLGTISAVLDEPYLPMFRSRQMNYKQLWDFSVKLSAKKQNQGHYLAKLWGARSLKKTLEWLTKLVEGAKSAVAEKVRAIKSKAEAKKEAEAASILMNRAMRRKFERMKFDYMLP